MERILLENHPQDSRVKIVPDGVCQSLNGKMGTGGGNTPMILEIYDDDDICEEPQGEKQR